MVALSLVHGKRLAVVLIGSDEEKKEEGAVFFGIARWDGQSLQLNRGREKPSFTIPSEVLGKLQKVDEKLRDILQNADYWISLTVSPLPEGADLSQYRLTGLKWPKQS